MKKLSVEEIVRKIKEVHGDNVILDESTYINTYTKCRFIDFEYGEWWTVVHSVLRGARHKDGRVKKIKETCLDKYGVDCVFKDEGFRNRIRNTMLEKYGVEYSIQSKEIYEKVKKTNLERYGTECSLNNKHVREKTKNTCLEKYNVDHVSKSDVVKKKVKETNMKRYGVVCSLMAKSVNKKARKTMIERYGAPYSFQSEKIKEKIQDTMCERYGVRYSFQSEIINEKKKRTMVKRYGVEYSAQNRDIALKQSKSLTSSYITTHWKTGEELVCVAAYEKTVVMYLNKNRIDFKWQPKVFKMPNGKTYRPDLYLVGDDLWVEIKGFFRNDSEEKWNWFHEKYPNSELWKKNKILEIRKKLDGNG